MKFDFLLKDDDPFKAIYEEDIEDPFNAIYESGSFTALPDESNPFEQIYGEPIDVEIPQVDNKPRDYSPRAMQLSKEQFSAQHYDVSEEFFERPDWVKPLSQVENPSRSEVAKVLGITPDELPPELSSATARWKLTRNAWEIAEGNTSWKPEGLQAGNGPYTKQDFMQEFSISRQLKGLLEPLDKGVQEKLEDSLAKIEDPRKRYLLIFSQNLARRKDNRLVEEYVRQQKTRDMLLREYGIEVPEREYLPESPKKSEGWFWENVNALTRSTLNVAGGIMNFAGEMGLTPLSIANPTTPSIGISNTYKAIKPGESLAHVDAFDAAADHLFQMSRAPTLQPGEDQSGFTSVTTTVTEALPYFIGALAATAIGGPAGGFAFGGSAEGGLAMRELEERGASEAEQKIYGSLVGIANGLVETLQVSNILRFANRGTVGKLGLAIAKKSWKAAKGLGKDLTIDAFQLALTEGAEEAIQEFNTMGAIQLAADEKLTFREWLTRLGDATLQGATIGPILGGIGGARGTNLFKNLVQEADSHQQETEKLITRTFRHLRDQIGGDYGYSDSQLAQVAGAAVKDWQQQARRKGVKAKEELESLWRNTLAGHVGKLIMGERLEKGTPVPQQEEENTDWKLSQEDYYDMVLRRQYEDEMEDVPNAPSFAEWKSASQNLPSRYLIDSEHKQMVRNALKTKGQNAVPREALEAYRNEPWAEEALSKQRQKEISAKPKKRQRKRPTDTVEPAMQEKGYKIEWPSSVDENGKITGENPNALQVGDTTYPTIVSEDGKTAIAISDTPIWNRDGEVWVGSPEGWDPGELTVTGIVTDPSVRGQGNARQALKDLIDVADSAGIKLVLEPTQIEELAGKGALSTDQLIKWYKSMGFKQQVEGSNAVLEREPQPGQTEVEPDISSSPQNEGEMESLKREKQRLKNLQRSTSGVEAEQIDYGLLDVDARLADLQSEQDIAEDKVADYEPPSPEELGFRGPPKERNSADEPIYRLPDMVKILQLILDDKIPEINNLIYPKFGHRGEFVHRRGDPGSRLNKVRLAAEIFIGPQIDIAQAAKSTLVDETMEQHIAALEEIGWSREEIETRTYYNKKNGKVIIRFFGKDPNYAARTLAHEIGHVIDYLPEGLVKGRGNVLGHIKASKGYIKRWMEGYPGGPPALNKKEVQNLRYIARQELREPVEITEEQFEETIEGVSPEDILIFWRAGESTAREAVEGREELYEYLKSLDRKDLRRILTEALKGMIPEEVKQFGKIIRKKTGETKKTLYREPSAKQVAEKFNELFEKATRRRMVIDYYKMMEELTDLSMWWQGWTPEQKDQAAHRTKPEELYADAISVLFNNPSALQDRAPHFWRAFWAYMPERQKVEQALKEVRENALTGANQYEQIAAALEAFEEGDKKRKAQMEDKTKTDWSYLWHGLKANIMDLNELINQLSREDLRKGVITPEESPHIALSSALHSLNSIEIYYTEVQDRLVKQLDAHNITERQFALYLMLQRIINEPLSYAQPGGQTRETAAELLDSLQKLMGLTEDQAQAYLDNPQLAPEQLGNMSYRMGEAKMEQMEQARKLLRELREEYVLPILERSGLYSEDLMQYIKDFDSYVTWQVVKHIEKKYGGSNSGKIFRRIGTMEMVADPLVETLMKDASLVRAAYWNLAKKSIVDYLGKHHPELVDFDVRQHFSADKGHQVFDPPKDSADKELFLWTEQGKLQGAYVEKAIVDGIDNRWGLEQLRPLTKLLRLISSPVKAAFVGVNVGFWVNNIQRDFQRSLKNLQGAGLAGVTTPQIFKDYEGKKIGAWRLLMSYFKTAPSAFKSVYGSHDQLAERALRNNMLMSVADARAAYNDDTALVRLLNTYVNSKGGNWGSISEDLSRGFHHFMRIGEGFERTGKLAALNYLDEAFPDMPVELKAQIVRERAGSPDFQIKGWVTPFTNSIFLFSNPMIQAWRSDYHVFRERPGETAWNTAKYCILPKAFMWMLRSGALYGLAKAALPDEDEDTSRMLAWLQHYTRVMEGVSTYDAMNYHILPIGLDENNKSIYLRIPMDEGQRFLGGMAWQMMETARNDFSPIEMFRALNYGADQLPGVNPVFSAGFGALEYLSGNNPYDYFYGRKVVPEHIFQAYDSRAHTIFAKWFTNKIGLLTPIHRFSTADINQLRSTLEQVVEAPGLSNIVGRFIKVSDYGIAEKAREVAQPGLQERARLNLDLREIANKLIAGRPLTAEEEKLRHATPRNEGYVEDWVERGRKYRRGDAWQRSLLGASYAARDRITKELADRNLPLEEYAQRDINHYAWMLSQPRPVRRAEQDDFFQETEKAIQWFRERRVGKETITNVFGKYLKGRYKSYEGYRARLSRLQARLRNF